MKGIAFAYDPDGYYGKFLLQSLYDVFSCTTIQTLTMQLSKLPSALLYVSVEIVKRTEPGKIKNYFNFSQTMLRIKDPSKTIPFYEAMGMTVVRAKNYGDFSNYFLASPTYVEEGVDYDGLSEEDAKAKVSSMFGPVLELTHNHGTENDDDFKHYNGNEEGRQGFGHIGFIVDDVYEACDSIREMGYGFKKVSNFFLFLHLFL